MKTLRHFLIFSTIFSFFFISCSSSSDEDELTKTGPDFSISDLQGTWNATSAFFSPSDPNSQSEGVDIIAEGGSLSIVILSNGRFTMNFNVQGSDPFTVTGEMFFENNEFFAIRFDEEPNDYDYFGIEYTSTTLQINGGPDTAEWDFNGDGNDEPASVTLNFVKA